MIAVLAEGALRDGISILERCSQDTEGTIDENKIRELVGMPKLELVKEITQNLIEEEPEKSIDVTNTVIGEGKDLDNFLWEVIKYIKDILIYKTTKKLELYSKEDIEFISSLADKAIKEKLLELIYELSELANNMKISNQKNIIFQAGIIKACMHIVEKQQAVEYIQTAPKPITNNAKKEQTITKTVQQEKTSPAMKTSPVQNMGKYVPYWQNVLDKIRQGGKMTIYANLIGTKGVLVNDLIVGIEFPGKVTEFAKKVLEEHENKTLIEKIVSMEQGKPMQIKILDKNADSQPTKKQGIEGFAEEQDITFNVIDE